LAETASRKRWVGISRQVGARRIIALLGIINRIAVVLREHSVTDLCRLLSKEVVRDKKSKKIWGFYRKNCASARGITLSLLGVARPLLDIPPDLKQQSGWFLKRNSENS
jgi:hypothetical protein